MEQRADKVGQTFVEGNFELDQAVIDGILPWPDDPTWAIFQSPGP